MCRCDSACVWGSGLTSPPGTPYQHFIILQTRTRKPKVPFSFFLVSATLNTLSVFCISWINLKFLAISLDKAIPNNVMVILATLSMTVTNGTAVFYRTINHNVSFQRWDKVLVLEFFVAGLFGAAIMTTMHHPSWLNTKNKINIAWDAVLIWWLMSWIGPDFVGLSFIPSCLISFSLNFDTNSNLKFHSFTNIENLSFPLSKFETLQMKPCQSFHGNCGKPTFVLALTFCLLKTWHITGDCAHFLLQLPPSSPVGWFPRWFVVGGGD